MEQSLTQPQINEMPDVEPVSLPDSELTLPERINRIEEELNISEN